MTITHRRYLTPAEYAALTGVPVSTVRHQCEAGTLPARKPKGRWRIPVAALPK
jgi:excisionase family DNA binding protein